MSRGCADACLRYGYKATNQEWNRGLSASCAGNGAEAIFICGFSFKGVIYEYENKYRIRPVGKARRKA